MNKDRRFAASIVMPGVNTIKHIYLLLTVGCNKLECLFLARLFLKPKEKEKSFAVDFNTIKYIYLLLTVGCKKLECLFLSRLFLKYQRRRKKFCG